MKSRLVAVAVAAGTLVAPAAAQGATFNPNKPCYGGGDLVRLNGAGYTPGGQVGFVADGTPIAATTTAGPTGAFSLPFRAPVTRSANTRRSSLTATDRTNPALTATAGLVFSKVLVTVRPSSGAASKPRRISARGFTTGKTLYMHIRRKSGGRSRNVRLGRLKRACRKLSTKRRIFSSGAAPGSYRVIFDTNRRFRRRIALGYFIDFTVRRVFRFRRSSVGAAGSAFGELQTTVTGSGAL